MGVAFSVVRAWEGGVWGLSKTGLMLRLISKYKCRFYIYHFNLS